jgi:hypothetical protein
MLCLLLFVSLFSHVGGVGFGAGISAGLKYNKVRAYQEWDGGSRSLGFDQLQAVEEVAAETRFSNLFALEFKFGFIHDVLSGSDLFDTVRGRDFYVVKVGPEFAFGDSWFVFSDFLVGGAFFRDNMNSFMVIGADAGSGMKVFDLAGGKAEGYLRAYFEYLRGSYANEFGAGLSFALLLGGG